MRLLFRLYRGNLLAYKATRSEMYLTEARKIAKMIEERLRGAING